MSKIKLPRPSQILSQAYARRFMLAHQRLWPPRRLEGKAGIMDFVRHVGCIQFDPLNVVGRNPDLALQSRVANYRPNLLEELLYADRQLLDGWDKMAAIYPITDWPYFTRHRAYARQQQDDPSRYHLHGVSSNADSGQAESPPANSPLEAAPAVIEAIRQRGPLSSIDLKHMDEKVEWAWGYQIRVVRAALEILYATGEVVIHHRVGTRRAFDLAERILPAEQLAAPDPNPTDEDYQNWHVLRRVGGLGLANPSATDYWLGILGVKSRVRQATLARLTERGDLVSVAVEDAPKGPFFIRAADLPTLERVQAKQLPEPEAAIIGALDNFTWDRDLIRWLFDFDYVWEVYKPKAKRKYGYYVLPVIYGDRFVARFDPAFDKKRRTLTITNWWWEPGIGANDAMQAALATCFQDFMRYLDASHIQLGGKVAGEETLRWVPGLNSQLKK
jgi:uncharacterized protein YcaQ